MAPNLFDQTLTSTCNGYAVSTSARTSYGPANDSGTSYGYENEYYISIVDRATEVQIKKILKRMMDDMCKDGWIFKIPFYSQPKLQPISLRGVRLYGRGWANQK